MKPIERMIKVFRGELPDRVPFVPTIYEHAAALINKTPTEVAQSEILLTQGQLKAYELYGHDLIVIGIDIYNIEVEALGSRINYYKSNVIPSLDNHILEDDPQLFTKIKLPNPEKDGRMPLILNAATSVKHIVGNEVDVAIPIVGPFTLAVLLRGYQKLVSDLFNDPEYVRGLLDFTTEVGLAFGRAITDQGIGIAINDSWIAQPLISPFIYKEFVFSCHQKLVTELKDKGANSISIISGGNTTAIADLLVMTGSSILMADYNTDLIRYKNIVNDTGVVLRGSIESKALEMGSKKVIEEQTLKVLREGASGGHFVLGCGVVGYNVNPENLLYLKKLVEKYGNY